MNKFYQAFVESGKSLAREKDLRWELPYDQLGVVYKASRWNLTSLCGMVPPPIHWLGSLGFDENALPILNSLLERIGRNTTANQAMSRNWQDLYQSVILNELLIKRNRPRHAIDQMARHIRILATCSGITEPWELTSEIIQLTYNVTLLMGNSGKLAANMSMVVRTVIDGLHLADNSPLASFCVPYPNPDAVSAEQNVKMTKMGNNSHRRVDKLRSELSQRKRSEKLPEEKAFWELIRIIFTEKPQSISDGIRFCQAKLAIVTGFRIGENATLPADWERWKEYIGPNGRPAGEKGGISRSLMIRHFAEKQSADEGTRLNLLGLKENSVVLYEAVQHVPAMFEELIIETLETARQLTKPLRDRLKLQTETGRLFPELHPNQLVASWDFRSRCSGSLHFADRPIPESLILEYRNSLSLAALEDIRSQQIENMIRFGQNARVGQFWSRIKKQHGLTAFRCDGRAYPAGKRVDPNDTYFRVGEVEALMSRIAPTKKPDTAPFTLADGAQLYPYELIFLLPINDRIESMDRGVLDVANYFAVGRAGPQDLSHHLGGLPDNLFSRYGETEEDRKLSLNSHSLRHLQNGELFRLGVADTIITKRFGRRSIAQSYEYNHASLSEDLANIDLPLQADKMGPRAQEVLKMILSGKVSGTVVGEFKRTQKELGDDAAFDYLNAEADGLHVTPYGFCINSFSVDPCPKHIECFNGCRHLCRTNIPEEQNRLESLYERFQKIILKIKGLPEDDRTTGWQNQLEHAEKRLINIQKLLVASPGERPFPDGPDLYCPIENNLGQTIMDFPRIPIAE